MNEIFANTQPSEKKSSGTEVVYFLWGFLYACGIFSGCLGGVSWMGGEGGGSWWSPQQLGQGPCCCLLGGSRRGLGDMLWCWLHPFKQAQHLVVHAWEWCACRLGKLCSLYWGLAAGTSSADECLEPLTSSGSPTNSQVKDITSSHLSSLCPCCWYRHLCRP